jgi:hypothetical protein
VNVPSTTKLTTKDLDIGTITAYLEGTGWKRTQHSNKDIIVFEGPQDDEGKPIKLVLPRKTDFQDSYLRLGEAIDLLAAIQEKSPQDVIQSMKSKPHPFNGERGRLWIVEVWKDERDALKMLTQHVLAFVLFIGALVLFHKLFEFLSLPPQQQELLERINYYGMVSALVLFGFSFTFRVVDQIMKAVKRKSRASRLLKLQMERVLSEEVRLSGKQLDIYIEQELYRMGRTATQM